MKVTKSTGKKTAIVMPIRRLNEFKFEFGCEMQTHACMLTFELLLCVLYLNHKINATSTESNLSVKEVRIQVSVSFASTTAYVSKIKTRQTRAKQSSTSTETRMKHCMIVFIISIEQHSA